MSLLERLNKLADAEYKACRKLFQRQVVLGVRLPALRIIIKHLRRKLQGLSGCQ